MNNKLFLFLVFTCWFGSLSAQIEGKLTTIEGEPLVGANVVWQNTTIGTVTDEEGKFTITEEGVTERILVFSYIGFNTETLPIGSLKYWEVQLIEDYTLTEVEVTAQEKATRFANTPAKVEVIGVREIERAACCSLAGCFSTNSSVNSATTNVVTDAKELRILGVSGVYNQLLFDGMPLIQGLGFAYGPGSYPGTMIENIFISKGTNSVLQGFESISGQINIIPPKPESAPKLFLNAFANSFGESQYNVNYMAKKGNWNNFTTAHLTLPAQIVDQDGDQFRDVVRTQRVSFYNKWSYANPDNNPLRAQVGVRFWDEVREGGTLDYSRKRDLGSPTVYGQSVDITQVDLYGKLNYKISDQLSLTWLNSAFHQNQESYFGVKKYEAQQTNVTSSLYADQYYGEQDHNLKYGASWRINKMEEEISFLQDISFLNYDGFYNSDFDIPGGFIENTFNLSPFTIIAGIRADYHGKWGWKTTPRFLVRAELAQETDIRFSIGKGFRRVQLFAERVSLLASNRDIIFEEELAPEEALNIGLNGVKKFRLPNIDVTLAADGYYILFQNQIFPDYNRGVGKAYVSNFNGESISQSFQFENKWEFFERFDVKWSYNYLNVYQMREGIKMYMPFVAKHRFLANASYATKKDDWQFDLTYQYFGSQRLPHTHDYPVEYRQPHQSDAYGRFDFQLTRRWSQFEIYTGVENILNFRQEFPILAYDDPYGPYFDTEFNWGPTKGREIYIGLRYRVR